MNASKLSDWLQMTAAIGVIAGLMLVAYEIRVSNRIGLDQHMLKARIGGMRPMPSIRLLRQLTYSFV